MLTYVDIGQNSTGINHNHRAQNTGEASLAAAQGGRPEPAARA
jgi:hypothetical protein